ncbi:hypothetical protein N4G58_11595 [Edwardsiella piscicida]|nr:hypothetical protein N4G58_11595 [Edwardsiella piscicida]
MGYRVVCCLCFCWLLSGCAQAGDADARTLIVRGTLSAVSPGALQLRERHGGELALRLTPRRVCSGCSAHRWTISAPAHFWGRRRCRWRMVRWRLRRFTCSPIVCAGRARGIPLAAGQR